MLKLFLTQELRFADFTHRPEPFAPRYMAIGYLDPRITGTNLLRYVIMVQQPHFNYVSLAPTCIPVSFSKFLSNKTINLSIRLLNPNILAIWAPRTTYSLQPDRHDPSPSKSSPQGFLLASQNVELR